MTTKIFNLKMEILESPKKFGIKKRESYEN